MKIAQSVITLSRFNKRLISITIDIIGLLLMAVLAIWIRLGDTVFPVTHYVPAIVLLPLLAVPVFIVQGLYRAVIRYLGHRFAFTVLKTVSLTFLLWTALIFMLDLSFPRSAIIITWLLTLFYVAFTRISGRWLLSEWLVKPIGLGRKPVVVFGAGSSGKQLMSAMSKSLEYKVVSFIDDDKSLHKQEVQSVKVCSRDSLSKIIKHYGVKDVFVAIPSLKESQRKRILNWLEPYPVKVSILPGLDKIMNGDISFTDVREIEVEDLLGRDPVPPQIDLLAKLITDKSVLITGAGGSIGSEICRQVMVQKPKRLVLFEMSEFALYNIERELQANPNFKDIEFIAILGSILDDVKLERIMRFYRIETIYHAAAYKHVPIVEHNLQEGIVNNSFGTHVLAKTGAEQGVKNFVLISTDKAVRPTNVMGASKRLAEMALQALQDEYTQTCFVMVRFGNVLGSSGSVIPLFKKQIANGGPVTVTHKEITRYFMTIPEAASLVIQAGSMGVGGDVFVLDMGEPVKIFDLAQKVVKLSGLEVMNEQGEGDIEIQYTGLRPGEKLYEELLIGDNVDGTDHPRIMKAHEDYLPYAVLMDKFASIENSLQNYQYDQLLIELNTTVSGFHHSSGIVDYLSVK